MAEKRSEPVYGGYDYEFVDKISGRLNCSICTKVLRDPHIAICCDQHFCESCLIKWSTKKCKHSCPHCRAEGEAFNHVIHKDLRSEVNELKIRCNNHGEGCQWTGELGGLKKHLESDKGCDFVMVECPNKCHSSGGVKVMKRKDVHMHLTHFCSLQPFRCQFCGLEDTYEAITGDSDAIALDKDDYGGHQATCSEAPLTCPNKCGSDKIKRKELESHRRQCPQEPVECPFAKAGCNDILKHWQLEAHVISNQQQHNMLLVKGYKEMKTKLFETERELFEVKAILTTAVQLLRQGGEADKETVDTIIASSSRLMKRNDLPDEILPKLPDSRIYSRRDKIWNILLFYC